MNTINKTQVILATVLLIVAIIGWFTPYIPRMDGGTGSLAIEDYNPTIMYNGGYYSNKPIETTSNLTVGGTTSLTGLVTFGSGGVKVGSSGTTVTQMLTGSGPLIYSDNVVASSTNRAFDIAVTGVTVNDNVFVQLATTTAGNIGWILTGASASSTSGFITLRIANATGASAALPTNISSSTNYLIVRD